MAAAESNAKRTLLPQQVAHTMSHRRPGITRRAVATEEGQRRRGAQESRIAMDGRQAYRDAVSEDERGDTTEARREVLTGKVQLKLRRAAQPTQQQRHCSAASERSGDGISCSAKVALLLALNLISKCARERLAKANAASRAAAAAERRRQQAGSAQARLEGGLREASTAPKSQPA